MLVGEDQHGIFRECVFDVRKIGRFERCRQVDVADFSDETGRDRTDGNSHGQLLRSVSYAYGGKRGRRISRMTDQASPTIKRTNPPELGVPPGYLQVVEVRGGRIIFIAGQTALDRNGAVVGKADFAQQAAQVFENLNIALQSVGCTAANLIKLTVFLRNVENFRLTEKPGIDYSLR